MPDDLYPNDLPAWSERQADLLRRLALGERVQAEIDWDNVIEEIRDVGRADLHAAEDLLAHALVHLLRLHVWPNEPSLAASWRSEAASLLARARRSIPPTLRRRISVADLFAEARYVVQAGTDRRDPPSPAPAACPYTLDELLAATPDIDALVARLKP